MNQNVINRIQSPGPKKILACDGGGILGLDDVNPDHVQLMDSVNYIDEIQRVGRAFAAKHVDLNAHFKGFAG